MVSDFCIFLTVNPLFLSILRLSLDITKNLLSHANFQSTIYFTIFWSLQVFKEHIQEILAFPPYNVW